MEGEGLAPGTIRYEVHEVNLGDSAEEREVTLDRIRLCARP
jgi:hypothetical protein